MPNANTFPDGRRGRIRPGDLSRVADYSASTLPRGGPGTTSRRFPSGTVVTPLLARAQAALVAPEPFALIDASDDEGHKVRVVSSTLYGDVPSGFSPGDTPPYVLDVTNGDIIYGVTTFDVSDPSLPVTSRTLAADSTMPPDDATACTAYDRIGSVSIVAGKMTLHNDGYGPISGRAYRLYYAYPAQYVVDRFSE